MGLPPLCPFHYLTGLPCPGCGLTRALVSCVHGQWHAAVTYHPLGPLVFVVLLGWILASILQLFWPQRRIVLPSRFLMRAGWTSLALLLTIWLARLAHWLPAPP